MFPQALGLKSYDQMLDAYNDRDDRDQDFKTWYHAAVAARASDECDDMNKPPVWIDEDDDNDGLMGVTAAVVPKPSGPTDLVAFNPSPDPDSDKQLVTA